MKVGDKVDDFNIELLNKLNFNLYESLKHGPVVLNFIMGTWCPFCSNHLRKIRLWQQKLGKNVTMLIISGESIERLRGWLDENPMSYLFASDENLQIIEQFAVKHMLMNIASPATFLIGVDKQIRMAFTGVRTDKARENMVNTICEEGKCLKDSEG